MKYFICNCTCPDYEELGLNDVNELIDFVDDSNLISKEDFLNQCEVEIELELEIKKFPNDFEFFENGEIMFFTNSCIEHFFKEEGVFENGN